MDLDEEMQSPAIIVEQPQEEIPVDIATEVVDNIIKAIPTGSVDQIPDQSTEAEGQENIPEEITKNVPTQETDDVQEEIPETLPEQITENAQDVPEHIAETTETATDQVVAETQGTEDIPEQIAGDEVHESALEQGSAAIPEQITEAEQENVAAAEIIHEKTTDEGKLYEYEVGRLELSLKYNINDKELIHGLAPKLLWVGTP